MPLPIEELFTSIATRFRELAIDLNKRADELASLNLAEVLLMAAPDIFRKLIDDDKAKAAENADLKAKVTDLEAEKAQVDALATEADALLNPAPPVVTEPTPTPDAPAPVVG